MALSVTYTYYPALSLLYPLGTMTSATENMYFAGRLIRSNGKTVVTDHLGSVRANESGEKFEYYPYGDEITSTPTANDREKFATYTRESGTGLDYAQQRYYSSTYGRFNTADPYKAIPGANDRGSWNRYSYVQGDPVNGFDPSGLFIHHPDDPDVYTSGLYNYGCEAGEFIYSGYAQLIDGFESLTASHMSHCGGGVGDLQAADHPQPPPPPPPSCEDKELIYLSAYLGRYGSPLVSSARTILEDSDQAGVDDRFIVALAGQESRYGTNITRGPFNAWNNLAHTATHNPYQSWDDAISGVVNLITGRLYFGAGLTTTDTIYARYDNKNDPKFAKQLEGLNSIYLGNLGGGILSDKKEVDFSRCTTGNRRTE